MRKYCSTMALGRATRHHFGRRWCVWRSLRHHVRLKLWLQAILLLQLCQATACAQCYAVITTGRCTDHDGLSFITSRDECTTAIAQANEAIGKPGYGGTSTQYYSFQPKGCSAGCKNDYAGYFCRKWNTHETGATVDDGEWAFCSASCPPSPPPPSPPQPPAPPPGPPPSPPPWPPPYPPGGAPCPPPPSPYPSTSRPFPSTRCLAPPFDTCVAT